MTLRDRFLDAIIDGRLGNGIVVTRQELIEFFPDEKESTTGVFLSNSEVNTGTVHSPMYEPCTLRVEEGRYRVLPQALLERMYQRHLL